MPSTSFDGVVHSVFAHACNIACNRGLFTVVASGLGDGPTVWRLADSASPDFRHLFSPGERLWSRHGIAVTRGIGLDLSSAERWHPAAQPAVSAERLAANLEFATTLLERCRRRRRSVVDREATSTLRTLEDACARLDIERATADLHRLVGWGEGLTPSGDDAIVGLLAALDAFAGTDADRLAFLRSLSAAVNAQLARTTVISGHYLRLAAQRHFNADVTQLAHALVGGDDSIGLSGALGTALNVGATSGADMVTGMITGFRAWGFANK